MKGSCYERHRHNRPQSENVADSGAVAAAAAAAASKVRTKNVMVSFSDHQLTVPSKWRYDTANNIVFTASASA